MQSIANNPEKLKSI